MTLDQVLGDGRIEGLGFTGGYTDSGYASGLMINQSAVVMSDCVVTNNRSQQSGGAPGGGGLYAYYSTMLITNCLFRDNETFQMSANSKCYGGGLYVFGGSLTLCDSVVRNNRSYNTYSGSGPSYGGGIYIGYGFHRLVNSLIMNNAGEPGTLSGGGVYVDGGGANAGLSIENCTLVGNVRQGINRATGPVTVTNSILWGNGDDLTGAVTVVNSDIQTADSYWTNGVNGCISADPMFERGFYLANGSPCVNAGGDQATAVGLAGYTTRADGTPDTVAVDLGYHQKAGISAATADLYVSLGGADGNTGTNWTQALPSITAALRKAADGTRIHVASGTYSNNTETFPLVLDRPGIQILGTNRNNTIINATGANARVFTAIGTAGDAKLEGITITRGLVTNSTTLSRYGGGVYVENGKLQILDCAIVSNSVLTSLYTGESTGGGLYVLNGTVLISNTLVRANSANQGGNSNSKTRGGGISAVYSDMTLVRCAISENLVDGTGGGTLRNGGGYYGIGGTHRFRNVVIVRNGGTGGGLTFYGAGAYIEVGANVTYPANTRMENCTVATNFVTGSAYGGLYQSGGIWWITNSILFTNNVDCSNFEHDGLTLTKVNDSCVSDGQNNGILGCTNANPLFVDLTYAHLKSHGGQYQGGFFTDGTWGQDPTTNSPYIDAGRIGADYQYEPNPNGRRLNWGAYGNTPAASKTFLEEPGVFSSLTVHSYGPSEIGSSSAKLTGEILHDGGQANADVYLCWGGIDQGTTGTGGWAHVGLIGTFPAFTLFNTNMTGLAGVTYFRFFVTNSSGSDFSAPVDQVMLAQPPTVTNAAASSVRRRTAILNATVTFTGGVDPDAWFYYWQQGSGTTNVVSKGPQGGTFNAMVGDLIPGATYNYQAFVSNAAGPAWSDTKSFTPLEALPRGWYVATNGNNTAGTNWTTALTDLQLAMNTAESNDTLYVAGNQTFMPLPFYTFSWTTSWVTVEGGYQATGVSPGSRDPTQWPTILTRDPTGGGVNRVLTILCVTNGVLRGVTVQGGLLPSVAGSHSFGGGLYVTNSVFLVEASTITNNEVSKSTYQYASAGGGIYAVGSQLTVSNSFILGNRASQVGNANSIARGGGLALYNGTSTVVRTVIRDNSNPAPSGQGDVCYGGGIFISGGQADIRNCLLIANRAGSTQPVSGGGIYSESATTRVMQCTIVTNDGQGVWQASGTVSITNSILWGHTDDLTGTVSVAYCDIQTADSFWTNGVNGCLSVNPLFVDTTYYHLQSVNGNYVNGYFSGGTWGHSSFYSPCLDRGDPLSPKSLEPNPNGNRANLGAYGNTEVASNSGNCGTIFTLR